MSDLTPVTELRPALRSTELLPDADVARPAWNGWAVCPHVYTVYFDQGLGLYDIDFERITTEGCWWWMRHLDGKNWVTDAVLTGFWRACESVLGWVAHEASQDHRKAAIRAFALEHTVRHPVVCYNDGEA